LLAETGDISGYFWTILWHPVREIIFSIVFGGLIAVIFSFIANRLKNVSDILVMIIGFILITAGLCSIFHLSIIFTNMVTGLIIVNTQRRSLVHKINDHLPIFMPLLFIMFFTLAGSNLHISALASLGLIGIVYTITRSVGLIGGSRLGASLGKVEDKIKKYLGLGILSQAGVAIGLSLIVKKDFYGLGRVIDSATGMTTGDEIGATVLTTITVTCIFFELIGPILTKYALKKAGEINEE
jgi:Kef-type K+ transport system membrane component KefB